MKLLPQPFPPGHLRSKKGLPAPWTDDRRRAQAKGQKTQKARKVQIDVPANPWDARK